MPVPAPTRNVSSSPARPPGRTHLLPIPALLVPLLLTISALLPESATVAVQRSPRLFVLFLDGRQEVLGELLAARNHRVVGSAGEIERGT